MTTMEMSRYEDDEHEEYDTDEKGNRIIARRVYGADAPAETVKAALDMQPPAVKEPVERAAGEDARWERMRLRDLPLSVDARRSSRTNVMRAIGEVSDGRNEALLFDDHILSAIAGMRATPVLDSLSADPDGAAIVKDEYAKLKLGTRLEAALNELKRKARSDRAADQKRVKENWAEALDAPAVTFEKSNETASEFGKCSDKDSFNDRLEMRARMNEEYAVVLDGGKVRIMHQAKLDVTYLTVDDFKQLFAPIVFKNFNGNVSAATDWLNWRYRTEYLGVGFYPGSKKHKAAVPQDHFNLWRGLAIEPKSGDWSLFKSHLLNVICQGKVEHNKFLLDWLAHIVQRPQEKPGTCIALKGQEGAGKSILFEAMAIILGKSAMSVSQSKQVVGNFNSHLEHNLLLGIEEALWAGDKAHEGVLKDLITAKEITIEPKGRDVRTARSYSRLMLLTNNDWCAPVGPNSRRYFVLEVKNNLAAKKEYFDPLYIELQNGGVEAMLDELLNRDISESNLRFAPETTALLKQREQSLSNLERWTLELARTGSMVSRDGDCHSLHASKSATIATNKVREAAKQYCGTDHGFNRALSPLLIELGVTTIRPRVLGKQVPCYEFPPIDHFRANVKKRLRVEIENYADDEDDDDACAVPDIIVTGYQRAPTMTAMLQ